MCLKRILSLTLLCRQLWTVTNSLHIWFFSVFSHQHFHEIQPVISKTTWKRPHLYCKDCSSVFAGRTDVFKKKESFFSKILSPFPLFLLLFFPLCFCLFLVVEFVTPPSFFLFFLFLLLLKSYFYLCFNLLYIYKT